MNDECRTKTDADEGGDPHVAPHSAFSIRHCLPLALLTLFAALIRFYHIGHPALWYDESMVFWRTCGSYGQLLDCLRTDGFVPLHYSLVWVITRFFRPTPMVLRFVPALSGTLMVPAVYFLSRQLLPRRTSLLAAAFTACSAFTLFYSRDAKMYMDAWFFVTLNLGCLLWWFRSESFTAWLCWIACGAAACGLQITSAIPIALSLLLLFTQDKMRWQQTLLWVGGVLLIFAGPIGHYEKFNIWIDQVEEDGWQKSQLQWINAFNYGRTGPELLRYLGTSMMMGWEWPRADTIAPEHPEPAAKPAWPSFFSAPDAEAPKIPRERFNDPAICAEIILGILIAGCLPWPRRWRGLSEVEINPQPQWRVVLWLSLLIVLPVYGFYCRSMPGFAGPAQWWDWIRDVVSPFAPSAVHPHFSRWGWMKQIAAELEQWYWWTSLLILLAIAGQLYVIRRDRQLGATLIRGLAVLIVIATMVGLCWVIATLLTAQAKAAAEAGKPWESLWVPRYLGFIWPMVAMAVAALLMRLPTRPARILVIVFLLGVNLAVAARRICGQTEPPVDLMARDATYALDESNHTITRMDISRGAQYPGGGNLFSGPGEYYMDLLSNTPTDPPAFKRAVAIRERQRPDGFPPDGPIEIPADVDRIIVWNQSPPAVTPSNDNLLPRLDGWKLLSDLQYQARDCWIWQDLATYRRREYVRIK